MDVDEIALSPHGWGTGIQRDSPEPVAAKGFPPNHTKSATRNPITPPVGEF